MTRRSVDWRTARSLFARALRAGATQKGAGVVHWNCAGRCASPHRVELVGRPEPTNGRWVSVARGTKVTLHIDMDTKCRKCMACLRSRRRHWAARASAEFERSARVWFVTLTWRPDGHVLALARARRAYALKSIDLDSCGEDEIFAARTRAMQAEIQRWLKRVRKLSKGQIRFLCVWEDHKSGLPHAHLLVHERAAHAVSERVLRTSWDAGFAQAKLAAHAHCNYVTKYLTKSLNARVVASIGYGRDSVSDMAAVAVPPTSDVLASVPDGGKLSDRDVMQPIGKLALSTDQQPEA